ncbi:MAG: SRPBCC domain-containing protein [Acidobacteriaceae bacterium]|nr:SRPBCC domain-containing protein [Acidobacteriaceae bacterium]
MHLVKTATLLVLGSMPLPWTAQNVPPLTKSPAGSARVVRVEGNINASVSEVWRVFTTSQGAEEFFAQKANIRLAIGGAYEIQFDPKDERSGTKGLKVLSYLPEEMISFEWNAPPEFPEVRNGGTWVVVEMRPIDAHQTHVSITHLGWKHGPEWDKAYVHFQRGWSELMNRLQTRFIRGPIDWSTQHMMYQGAKGPGGQ